MFSKRIAYLFLSIPNFLFSKSKGWSKRSKIYSPLEIEPAFSVLIENVAKIKAEYISLQNRDVRFPRYEEVDRFQRRIASSPDSLKSWRVFFFEAMGVKSKENASLCPLTSELISSIPNVFQACFSLLEGGKSIPRHRSPYWGYLRFHLTLEAPEINAPLLDIDGEKITWVCNKCFLFDDSHYHSVENFSTENRCVLIVDILRPLDAPYDQINRFCVWLLGWLYGRKLLQRATAFD